MDEQDWKFKDIKAGDRVLVQERVIFGLNRGKRFWIEVEVTRTTNTQFLIGNARFKKDYGTQIGSYNNAHHIGTTLHGTELYDQTVEMIAYKTKLNQIYAIRDIVDKIHVTDSSNNLAEIHDLLCRVEKLI